MVFQNKILLLLTIFLICSIEPICAYETGTLISGNTGIINHDTTISNEETIEQTVENDLNQNSEVIEPPIPPLLLVPDGGIEYPNPSTDLDDVGAIEYTQPSMPSSVDIEGYYPTGWDVQGIGGTPWQHHVGHVVGVGFTVFGIVTGIYALIQGGLPLLAPTIIGTVMGSGIGYIAGKILGIGGTEGLIQGAWIGSAVGLALGSIMLSIAELGPAAGLVTGSAWTAAFIKTGIIAGGMGGGIAGTITGIMYGKEHSCTLLGLVGGLVIGTVAGGVIGAAIGAVTRLYASLKIPTAPATIEAQIQLLRELPLATQQKYGLTGLIDELPADRNNRLPVVQPEPQMHEIRVNDANIPIDVAQTQHQLEIVSEVRDQLYEVGDGAGLEPKAYMEQLDRIITPAARDLNMDIHVLDEVKVKFCEIRDLLQEGQYMGDEPLTQGLNELKEHWSNLFRDMERTLTQTLQRHAQLNPPHNAMTNLRDMINELKLKLQKDIVLTDQELITFNNVIQRITDCNQKFLWGYIGAYVPKPSHQIKMPPLLRPNLIPRPPD